MTLKVVRVRVSPAALFNMFRFIRKKWKLLLTVIVILIISFVLLKTKFTPKQLYDTKSAASVKQGDLEETLTISGEIDAEEKATLRFATSGRLAWVGVKEGDFVKKFQGIASLDKRDVEKNLKKKLLAYMNERWDFEQAQDDKSVRGRRRVDVPGLTDAERRILDKAQFDLDSTVLDVEIQNLALEYANLWTPIAGLVTRIDAPFAGTNITAATAEFEIINPGSVYFKASADETEVTRLKEGIAGDLVLDAFPDESLSGHIVNISFIPDTEESGVVYTVKFTFGTLNPQYRYRLGMVGDLSFITDKKENVLYLPAKYILSDNGKKYVFRQKGKTAEKIYVKTGTENDENTQIIKGLKKGDKVYLPE